MPTAIPSGGFRVILDFKNGLSFTGFGRNKKGCQHHAAHLALLEIFGLSSILPPGAGPVGNPIPVVTSPVTEGMELNGIPGPSGMSGALSENLLL